MLVLITQVTWAINSYHQNKNEIKAQVIDALAITAKKTRSHSSCFEIFSKAYLKPGEAFFVSKLDSSLKMDTVPMLFNGRGVFYDESEKKFLEKFNRLDFTWPVSAEIIINFRYHSKKDSVFSKISQDSVFNRLDPTNYREVLAEHLSIEKLYDTHYMDSVLRAELKKRSITLPFSTGIIEVGKDTLVYKSGIAGDHALLGSEYHNNLIEEDEYFNKSYLLALVFDRGFGVSRNLWVMLLTSAFVVLLLIALMLQFIRVITRQRKINEMKNDFINNMTHEFNTPIANISLAAESLSKLDDLQKDEKTARLVSIIQEQNENMRGNVEHILKIAATDRELMLLNKETLNLTEVIKSVVYEFKLSLAEKGGTIDFIEPTETIFIQADELYILHALQNVIDNAIKYNRNKPVINISAQALDREVVISISDNGIGLSADEVKHIFDKFYRVSTGNIHHTKGFGLGLNYVQSIMKAHGGFVKVKSSPGKGSMFRLYIPKNNL